MVRNGKLFRALSAFVFFGAFALSAPKAAKAEAQLLSFDLAQITVLQGSGNAFSGFASWTPMFDLGFMNLKADLGASLLTNGDENFLAPRAQLLGSFGLFSGVNMEVGPGMQMWMEGKTNDPMPIFMGANFRYDMSPMIKPFLSYSGIFLGGLTHEIRVGAGIQF